MDSNPVHVFGGVLILLLTALASYKNEPTNDKSLKSGDNGFDKSMELTEDSEVFLVLNKNTISSARSTRLLLSYSKEIYIIIASYMDTDDILSFSRTCSLLAEEFSCGVIWEQLWRLRYGKMWRDFAYLRELRGIHWDPYANWGDPLSGWFVFYLEFEYCWANWLLAGCNNRKMCYLVLYSQIYDVTSFVPGHPGSAETLLEHCGSDATQSFIDIGHSNMAKQMSSTYIVGAPEYNVGMHEDVSLIISLVMNEQNKDGGDSSLTPGNMIQAIRSTMESVGALASSAMSTGGPDTDTIVAAEHAIGGSQSFADVEADAESLSMRDMYASLSTETVIGMVKQTKMSINTQEMYSQMLSMSTSAQATMSNVANSAKENMTRLSTTAKQTMTEVAVTAKQTMSDMFNPDNSDFEGDDGLSNMEIFDAIDSSLEYLEETTMRLRNKNGRAGSLTSSNSGSNTNSRRGSLDEADSVRRAPSSPSSFSSSRSRSKAKRKSGHGGSSYGSRRYHSDPWNQNGEGLTNMRHNVIYCLEIEKLAILNYLQNNSKTRLVSRSQVKVTSLQGHMSCNPNPAAPGDGNGNGNGNENPDPDAGLGLGLGLGNEEDVQPVNPIHQGNTVLSLIGLGGQHCGQPKLFYDPLAQEWAVWWSCCAIGEAIPYDIIKAEIAKLPIINSSSKRLSAYMNTAYSEYIANHVLRRPARAMSNSDEEMDPILSVALHMERVASNNNLSAGNTSTTTADATGGSLDIGEDGGGSNAVGLVRTPAGSQLGDRAVVSSSASSSS